jgi:hypothetical protein
MAVHSDTSDTERDRSFDLHSVVVSYEHRADRCTVYPRERSHYERLETWLSADADAFVSLREMR